MVTKQRARRVVKSKYNFPDSGRTTTDLINTSCDQTSRDPPLFAHSAESAGGVVVTVCVEVDRIELFAYIVV